MKIFFSVGEPSGDQHAAHLIESLRRRAPDIEFTGFGGPLMQRAGCRLAYELTNLAVMGFARVVPLLRKFWGLVQEAERLFREERPDAVVLIDFPGFNWWIARKAKAAGIPVIYYLPPQLWAWAPWRLRKMKRFVDHVLCGLSFEPKWYADRGMAVEYVGHPFFDEVAEYPLDAAFCSEQRGRGGKIVGILPGSRNHEVHKNWPLQVRVMRKLHAKHPDARFLVANYREQHRDWCRGFLEESQLGQSDRLPVEFHIGKTPEIIELADCCLMVSGSVSLEMLARRTPAAVLYRLPLYYVLMRPLVTVSQMTLPNLMAGRTIFPERVIVLRERRAVREMTAALHGWLSDPAYRQATVEQMDELAQRVAATGATGRAADAILARLGSSKRALRAA